VTRRILGRARRGDAGITLVETAVTMLILGFVSASVMVLMNGAQKMSFENGARLDQINAGRVAIEAMSRNLRAAIMPSQLGSTCADPLLVNDPSCAPAAFVSGTPTAVQFYANTDNANNVLGPSKVTYLLGGVGGTELIERIQRADARPAGSTTYTYCAPSPSCPVRERVLARGVVTGTPLFTYYDGAGTVMPQTTLDANALARVDAIEVTVAVRSPRGAVAPATFLQRVALPNADTVVRNDGT
jgi:type II secretory pathway pseudopilin PulG